MKKIEELEKEYKEEVAEISRQCVAEGYPSHGSNFELRVDQLNNDPYYAPLFGEREDDWHYIPSIKELEEAY